MAVWRVRVVLVGIVIYIYNLLLPCLKINPGRKCSRQKFQVVVFSYQAKINDRIPFDYY